MDFRRALDGPMFPMTGSALIAVQAKKILI